MDILNIDTQILRPAAEAENWNPARFDFRWNEDYSAFRLIPLQWWDDASYIAYQVEGL